MGARKVLFRTDGGHTIGLGHVHRCLALAEILAPEFELTFAIRNPLPGIAKMIGDTGAAMMALPDAEYLDEARSLVSMVRNFEIVVLDGYSFQTEYQQIIRSAGAKMVCIDDIHSFHFVCDAVINHAGGVQADVYSAEPYTKFFLGTEYCIVKKEFFEAASHPADRPKDDGVLVCMGGADPHNHTLRVLKECLQHQLSGRFYVIVGEAYQHYKPLQAFIDENGLQVDVLVNLSPAQLLQRMRECALAICPPSGISYEYLCVGGELYLEQTADNQRDIKNYLTGKGLAFEFSDFRISDKAAVHQLLKKQKQEFDGTSRQRLLKLFRTLSIQFHTQVRRATIDDLMIIFEWANDPETRRNAFSTRSISLEEHTQWFRKKLTESNVYLYIFEYDNIPAGQIRFDVAGDAVISYVIAPEYRGRGLGSVIVEKGIEKFRNDSGFPAAITAYVKQQNEHSNNIFLKLGFFQETDSTRENTFKYSIN